MSDKYEKYIGESSFKNTIKHVQNTSSNLTWYEEDKESFPIINPKSLWMDYNEIPENPEKDIFEITVNNKKIIIYKKYTVELSQTSKENIFYNKSLNQIIDKPNYTFKLFTVDGEEVPFGLNKWTYDNNSHLVFIEGLPDGWGTKFKVEFYRYEGRLLDDVILKRDGSVSLDSGYLPKNDNDIVTKEYVDSRIVDTSDALQKLLPEEPVNELSGKEITEYTITNNRENCIFKASTILGGVDYNITTYNTSRIKIISPLIYLRKKGLLKLRITIGNREVTKTLDLANLSNISDLKLYYKGPYYSDINSQKFFTGIKVYYEMALNESLLGKKAYTFQFILEESDVEIQKSAALEIGVDELPKDEVFPQNDPIRIKVPTKRDVHYVSGIPHFNAGTEIPFTGPEVRPLNGFFNKQFPLGCISFFKDDEAAEQTSLKYLPPFDGWNFLENPPVAFNGDIVIPDSFYTDTLDINASTFNIRKEVNGNLKTSYNFVIDTISKEENRVNSKDFTSQGYLHKELDDYDPKISLLENSELMMLNNLYQYPSRNFPKEFENSDWPSEWIGFPDYSKCEGIRYLTIKHTLNEYTTGIFVTMEGIPLNRDIKAFDVYSVEIKLGKDGQWLNGKLPYKGIGIPKKQGDGCLVAGKDFLYSNYYTFGYIPYKGTIYYRIGLSPIQKDLKFSSPVITSATEN